MAAVLKVLLLSLVALAVALLLETTFVPHVVPVAWSDEPQKLWAVETAFLLRSTEFTAVIVAVIALAGLAILGVRRRFPAACKAGRVR